MFFIFAPNFFWGNASNLTTCAVYIFQMGWFKKPPTIDKTPSPFSHPGTRKEPYTTIFPNANVP